MIVKLPGNFFPRDATQAEVQEEQTKGFDIWGSLACITTRKGVTFTAGQSINNVEYTLIELEKFKSKPNSRAHKYDCRVRVPGGSEIDYKTATIDRCVFFIFRRNYLTRPVQQNDLVKGFSGVMGYVSAIYHDGSFDVVLFGLSSVGPRIVMQKQVRAFWRILDFDLVTGDSLFPRMIQPAAAVPAPPAQVVPGPVVPVQAPPAQVVPGPVVPVQAPPAQVVPGPAPLVPATPIHNISGSGSENSDTSP